MYFSSLHSGHVICKELVTIFVERFIVWGMGGWGREREGDRKRYVRNQTQGLTHAKHVPYY